MQRLMLRPVVRPIVKALLGRQLDPVHELHVGTLVDLVRYGRRRNRE